MEILSESGNFYFNDPFKFDMLLGFNISNRNISPQSLNYFEELLVQIYSNLDFFVLNSSSAFPVDSIGSQPTSMLWERDPY